MPQLKPDAIIKEFIFSPEEWLNARVLNTLQIAYLQNLYATTLQEKLTSLVPTESIDDRKYLLSMGSVEGKLELLQELFQNHQQAISEANNPELKNQNPSNTISDSPLDDLATRAAKQVHQTS